MTSDLRFRMIGVAAVVFLLSLGIIFIRAGKVAEAFIESERNRLQLGQAAKLASVGELISAISRAYAKRTKTKNEALKDRANAIIASSGDTHPANCYRCCKI